MAGFLLSTRRARGSVDCKYAILMSEDKIRKPKADTEATKNKWKICVALELRGRDSVELVPGTSDHKPCSVLIFYIFIGLDCAKNEHTMR